MTARPVAPGHLHPKPASVFVGMRMKTGEEGEVGEVVTLALGPCRLQVMVFER